MLSIEIKLAKRFNENKVSLKEFICDCNFHGVRDENNIITAYYIIDKLFPYIALYSTDGGKYKICNTVEYDELDSINKQHYNNAKDRMISVVKKVRSGKIELDSWGNTNIDYDEYQIDYTRPVEHPNFRLDALLTNIKDEILEYVDIDNNMACIFTLWIAFSWIVRNFDISPLLIIKCDDECCDNKSAILNLFMILANKPVRASAISTNYFLEECKYAKQTVLFDDPTIIKRRDIHNLILNSHTRSHALKLVKEGSCLKKFETFGAKTLVSDGDLPKSIKNIGIELNLRHQNIYCRPLRMAEADYYVLGDLKYGLDYFAAHYSDLIKQAKLLMPDYLSNSEKDNWNLMFDIAVLAGGTWSDNLLQAVQVISASFNQDKVIRQQLLSDIYDIVKNRKLPKISSKALISKLCLISDKPWNNYCNGKSITPDQLAKLLKTYGIKSKNVRIKCTSKDGEKLEKIKKGYNKSVFEEAYMAELGVLPLTVQ